MIKKIVFPILLFRSFFCAASYDYSQEIELLLEQVDFVIFVLERNTIRMERYGLHELGDDINYLSKDFSKDHCQFKISLSGKDFRAHSIAWDEVDPSRLRITSGKRKNPTTYFLSLSKIFPEDTSLEDLSIVCFDCVVRHVDEEDKTEISATKSIKKSFVDIIIPFEDRDLCTQLVLDGSVRAACGFFVNHDVFNKGFSLTGKIKKEDALVEGLLISDNDYNFLVDKQEFMNEKDSEKNNIAQEQEVSSDKRSFFRKIKDGIILIKNYCGSSCSKIISCFF